MLFPHQIEVGNAWGALPTAVPRAGGAGGGGTAPQRPESVGFGVQSISRRVREREEEEEERKKGPGRVGYDTQPKWQDVARETKKLIGGGALKFGGGFAFKERDSRPCTRDKLAEIQARIWSTDKPKSRGSQGRAQSRSGLQSRGGVKSRSGLQSRGGVQSRGSEGRGLQSRGLKSRGSRGEGGNAAASPAFGKGPGEGGDLFIVCHNRV